MGIYIKGMKPPKDCYECPGKKWVDDGCAGCWADSKIHNASKPVDCQLVEIPEPHGRLIDADAYCKDLTEQSNRFRAFLKPETIERINRTVDDLKNYPAVVEAEGSENHDT